jgi:hypothetical protein
VPAPIRRNEKQPEPPEFRLFPTLAR